MTDDQINVAKAGTTWSVWGLGEALKSVGISSWEEEGTTWDMWGLGEALKSVGISSWGEAASAAAFILSILFIIDWFWKKIKSTRTNRDFPKTRPEEDDSGH